MYSVRGSLIIAFHGCDENTRDEIVASKIENLNPSTNSYDWLGHGTYFWENNYDRALQFAKDLKGKERLGKDVIRKPSVLGAVINLGNCLDLVDSKSLSILKGGYGLLMATMNESEFQELKNRPVGQIQDLLLRDLDCAVIESIHTYNSDTGNRPFDSVRGVFFEGKELYPNAGFKEKNHIQICIRNPNCIKGYFIPRKPNYSFIIP